MVATRDSSSSTVTLSVVLERPGAMRSFKALLFRALKPLIPRPSEPLKFTVPRSGRRPNLRNARLLERASGGKTRILAPGRADELHAYGQRTLGG